MKTIALFKKWLNFVDIVWSLLFIFIAIGCIGLIIRADFDLSINILIITIAISAWCFKVVVIGIAKAIIIIAQNVEVMAKEDKLKIIQYQNLVRKNEER